MTEQDWFDLEQEYRAVFGSNIPRMMLPSDDEAAALLVREAIEMRDDSVFDQGIPSSCAI
jgi:hypothetical protein